MVWEISALNHVWHLDSASSAGGNDRFNILFPGTSLLMEAAIGQAI